MNAALHGNLHIEASDPAARYARLALRLGESHRRLRTVAVAVSVIMEGIEIAVWDEGRWRGDGDEPSETSYSGRGLQLMRSFADRVAYDLEARCLTLRFSWPRGAIA